MSQNVVIFARSNHGHDRIQQQLQKCREYASERGLRIVGEIGLPNCSAANRAVSETLTGLIAQYPIPKPDSSVLVTDLARLSRNPHQGLHLLQRLRDAGWTVVATDDPMQGSIALPDLNDASTEKKKVVSGERAKTKEASGRCESKVDDTHRS